MSRTEDVDRVIAAISSGDMTGIHRWFRAHGLDDRVVDGKTLLLVAAEQGDASAVEWLLERGADPYLDDYDGWVERDIAISDTPLHRAAALDNSEALATMLRLGVDPDARDIQGETPLMRAAEARSVACLELLLESGASVGVVSRVGGTALHTAANGGSAEIARRLMDLGAHLNAGTVAGWTPLHCAAREGNAEVAVALLQRGADASLETEDGMTASDVAREHGFPDLEELMAST